MASLCEGKLQALLGFPQSKAWSNAQDLSNLSVEAPADDKRI